MANRRKHRLTLWYFWYFYLAAMAVVLAVAAAMFVPMPQPAWITLLTIAFTSPFWILIGLCFTDVFRDYGVTPSLRETIQPPDEPAVIGPPDETSEPARKPRKPRKTRTTPGYWHPLGGYTKSR